LFGLVLWLLILLLSVLCSCIAHKHQQGALGGSLLPGAPELLPWCGWLPWRCTCSRAASWRVYSMEKAQRYWA